MISILLLYPAIFILLSFELTHLLFDSVWGVFRWLLTVLSFLISFAFIGLLHFQWHISILCWLHLLVDIFLQTMVIFEQNYLHWMGLGWNYDWGNWGSDYFVIDLGLFPILCLLTFLLKNSGLKIYVSCVHFAFYLNNFWTHHLASFSGLNNFIYWFLCDFFEGCFKGYFIVPSLELKLLIYRLSL